MTPIEPPERCLVADISGPFAHFRRVGGNSTRQTYHVIPRTTAAGLFAAILGLGRDTYYQEFGPGESAMAIVPQTSLETMSLPRSELSTAPESPENISDLGKEFGDDVGIVTINKESLQSRQRNPYEMLRDVSYRIYLWLADTDLYETLHEYLVEGRSVYTPALGLSECLASIEFQGELTMQQVDTQIVDSVLPDDQCRVQPESGISHLRERVPLFMERTENGGRHTTAFTTYTTRRDGGRLKITDDMPVATPTDSKLDDHVIFH